MSDQSSARISLYFIDGSTTAVSNVKTEDTSSTVYTLQGTFVGHNVDTKTLPKGIYVINGRKVSIR